MKKKLCIFLSLSMGGCFLYAQTTVSSDSLGVGTTVLSDGELQINPDALRELQQQTWIDSPLLESDTKSWMQFDETLPVLPQPKQEPERKVVLTLHPYSANTRYDWDPVYQRKIKINQNTWRSDPFYAIYGGKKAPMGSRRAVVSGDFMLLFTKDFWRFQRRANRAKTLQILKNY